MPVCYQHTREWVHHAWASSGQFVQPDAFGEAVGRIDEGDVNVRGELEAAIGPP
jgi:hypothetical protein